MNEREALEARAFALHSVQPYSAGRLRRKTLVALRWTAIAGQALAVAIIALGFKFNFPLLPVAIVIAASALLNLLINYFSPLERRASDREVFAHLGFDIVQLGALLWLTGGLENPFALLFIAPVVTSAATLNKVVHWGLIGFTAAVAFLLMRYALPLPWHDGQSFTLPEMYKFGVWIALMTGIAFTSLYAWRAALEQRRMTDALAATEAVLSQEQKLAALGGLAAAAAHELGTPLATIVLTAKEMSRELAQGTELGDDARLMHSQALRCRDILQQLSRRGDAGDPMHDALGLRALLEEVAEPFFGLGTNITISLNGEGEPPILRRQAELVYGLTNIVENAVDFAAGEVSLSGRWDADTLTIDVIDDGPGFDPSVRAKLGEPYVSSRTHKSGAGGLGLGFFIAKTLLERTGGELLFGNRKDARGAMVRVRWLIEKLLLSEPIKGV
ncbi:MAG: ActS/PrrB/RegB family redox-sensitive histidine kinase [Robiginitomaculum sp.]